MEGACVSGWTTLGRAVQLNFKSFRKHQSSDSDTIQSLCFNWWWTLRMCRVLILIRVRAQGDGVEQLQWRLQHGELPPFIPPRVVVIACGTNSRGMVRAALLSLVLLASHPAALLGSPTSPTPATHAG